MKKLALLAALPLAMACTPPSKVLEGMVTGNTWQFTTIDGAAPVGKQASLTFQPGRVGANVGCNGMGADAKTQGGRIIAGPVMSTQMFCEGVMEQERAVGALLAAKPTVTVHGTTMTLRGGGHSAELKLKN